ncbi:MAG: DNA polymerase III subunit epsilon [Cellvibrionaceae bacterium]|nr:DNA polymerase III subunit epsilon [Cellvibrionaceae bacterium]
MRQIVLDTETTGLEPSQGHRIIEIGCVELINRKLTGRHYHQYIQPEREIDQQAIEVHGITNEFLQDKPVFTQIADEFVDFVKGAELIIHNAPFDVGFIDHEFSLLNGSHSRLNDYCAVIDSLLLARQKHPGQRNSLDALCKRYFVDNSQRDLHGALLDAEILADVYLVMTGGQTALSLGDGREKTEGGDAPVSIRRLDAGLDLPVINATADELLHHHNKLTQIDKLSGHRCLWLQAE